MRTGKLKARFANFALSIVVITVTLLFCEIGLRFFYELQPDVPLNLFSQKDEILGFKMRPLQAGHDENGFRNGAVLPRYDVVCIGDSMTYGVSATREDSYPSQLARMTGQSVYNMALPAYGPVQYRYLLENLAVRYKPKTVVFGLYQGNDFYDSFAIVDKLPYWKEYRPMLSGGKDKELIKLQRHIGRNRLTFFVGNLMERSIILQRLNIVRRALTEKAYSRFPWLWDLENERIGWNYYLYYGDGPVTTVFAPKYRLQAVDPKSPRINDGYKITIRAILDSKEFCDRNNIDFILLLIPPKELVYSDRVRKTNPGTYSRLRALVEAYNKRRADLIADLAGSVRIIDTLPGLREDIDKGIRLYSTGVDAHPNRRGYKTIAEAVARIVSEGRRMKPSMVN